MSFISHTLNKATPPTSLAGASGDANFVASHAVADANATSLNDIDSEDGATRYFHIYALYAGGSSAVTSSSVVSVTTVPVFIDQSTATFSSNTDGVVVVSYTKGNNADSVSVYFSSADLGDNTDKTTLDASANKVVTDAIVSGTHNSYWWERKVNGSTTEFVADGVTGYYYAISKKGPDYSAATRLAVADLGTAHAPVSFFSLGAIDPGIDNLNKISYGASETVKIIAVRGSSDTPPPFSNAINPTTTNSGSGTNVGDIKVYTSANYPWLHNDPSMASLGIWYRYYIYEDMGSGKYSRSVEDVAPDMTNRDGLTPNSPVRKTVDDGM